MSQGLNHGGSLEERVIKDDILLFLGERRCVAKSASQELLFLALTLNGDGSSDREKTRQLTEGHRKGRFGARTVGRL